MQTSLLEILREIPDHRRVEGRRFDLSTVLLYSILAMVAGANSYRQMHEFIRIHRQSLNAAFGLELRYSPSYTGLRLILRGVDPAALETAFRRHASTLAKPPATDGFHGDCRRRQDFAWQLRRVLRPQGRAYDVGVAARRPDRARASDGRGKEQRNPGRAGADRGARSDGLPVHARRRALSKKSFERVIESGNHLLTQVKDNQPGLRKSLALGSAGRKPRDCARSVTEGRRNRFETRRLEVFDAKAWFARTPWETLIKTVLRLERIVHRRDPATGLWTRAARPPSGSPRRKAFRRSNGTPGFAGIGASRTAAITSATRPSPRTLRASARTRTSRRDCDPSPIICSAPTATRTSKTPDGAPPSISTS